MPIFKLTPSQYEKIKNDPLHYNLSMRFLGKENLWEGECDTATMKRIKEIVDE